MVTVTPIQEQALVDLVPFEQAVAYVGISDQGVPIPDPTIGYTMLAILSVLVIVVVGLTAYVTVLYVLSYHVAIQELKPSG